MRCVLGCICCIFVGAAQTIAEMSIVNRLKVSNNV